MTDVSEIALSPAHAIELFDEIKAEYAWNVSCETDGILSVYFGPPNLVVREPRPDLIKPDTSPNVARVWRRRLALPQGPWHLFVYDGVWRVQAQDLACARDDTDVTNMERCLSLLSGQRLTVVTWAPDDKSWRFAFDLDSILTITADPQTVHLSEKEWIFYRKDSSILACVRDDDLTLNVSSNVQP